MIVLMKLIFKLPPSSLLYSLSHPRPISLVPVNVSTYFGFLWGRGGGMGEYGQWIPSQDVPVIVEPRTLVLGGGGVVELNLGSI